MNRTSTKKNLVYNFIYQITVMILPLITAPYLARVIGAEGVGIYSYYNSITMYFIYFAMLGISNYGNRAIAKICNNKENCNKKFSSIYYLQLITSFIMLILFILYVVLFANDKIVASIFGIYFISAFFDVSWLFFGLQEFKTTSLRQIIIRILTFVCILYFIKGKNDLNNYIVIMCVGNFISAFSLWLISWKKIKFKRCTMKEIMHHLKPCLILFIPIIATSVYRIMDIIMVGKMSNMNEVGYYENAEKLIYISLGLISSFSAVIMPKISNLIGNKNIVRAKELFDDSMEIAMGIGFSLGFGIMAVSKEFVPIYFGNEFIPSIALSIGLSVTIPIITWACIIRTLFLIPNERDNVYMISVIIGAIVNIMCNLILIPRIGTMGAVIGTIIAELSVAVYQTESARKEIRIKKYIKQSAIFFAFGIIMLFSVRIVGNIFNNQTIGLILEIVIGAGVYSICILIYLIKTKNKYLYIFLEKIGRQKNDHKKRFHG